MKIGLVVAMDKEYEQLEKLLFARENDFGNNEIILAKLGIGKVNAAIGTTMFINNQHLDLIISTGVAAGTDKVNILDVVVSHETVFHDVYCGSGTPYGTVQGMPARYSSPKYLIEKALEINEENNDNRQIHIGLIATGDKFIDSKELYDPIIKHFPETLAIDMESAAIAQTCYIHNIPFLSIRTISDVVTKKDNAKDYQKFWDNIEDRSFEMTHKFLKKITNL